MSPKVEFVFEPIVGKVPSFKVKNEINPMAAIKAADNLMLDSLGESEVEMALENARK